ncbi:hypothetical protein GF351_03300 [Candidatus Woesearchaeota archaeon]|nr:hypothetical protein [Candidatus Woesearchaeota archaeon]
MAYTMIYHHVDGPLSGNYRIDPEAEPGNRVVTEGWLQVSTGAELKIFYGFRQSQKQAEESQGRHANKGDAGDSLDNRAKKEAARLKHD